MNGIGAILILNDLAPSLNVVSCDKKAASGSKLTARQILTRFDHDKKSAGLR